MNMLYPTEALKTKKKILIQTLIETHLNSIDQLPIKHFSFYLFRISEQNIKKKKHKNKIVLPFVC